MRRLVSTLIVIATVAVAGCSSMAPGIQFSNANHARGEDAKEINPEIRVITPSLVKTEKHERDKRASDDISALMHDLRLKTEPS